MEVNEIPMVRLVGVQKSPGGVLFLRSCAEVQNHLGTIHAAAQFLLAEAASADFLAQSYPELSNSVMPVLRSSQIKYRNPANGTLCAYPTISEESKTRFLNQLDRKGRALIAIVVELRDDRNQRTFEGLFEWYIQKRTE